MRSRTPRRLVAADRATTEQLAAGAAAEIADVFDQQLAALRAYREVYAGDDVSAAVRLSAMSDAELVAVQRSARSLSLLAERIHATRPVTEGTTHA